MVQPSDFSDLPSDLSAEESSAPMATAVRRTMVWNLWFFTWLGLLAGLISPSVYPYVVYFSGIHALLFIYLEEGILTAFPVQVRLAYLVWVAIGTYVPYMGVLMPIASVGLASNLFWGYCPLARMLYLLLPWNRRQPLSPDLVKRVIFSPPMHGRFTL